MLDSLTRRRRRVFAVCMRRVGSWAAWWVALFFGWLVYVGEWNRVQIVAGGIAAAIAATAAEAVRSQKLLHYRFERRYLAQLGKVPVQVLREFGLVTRFLL